MSVTNFEYYENNSLLCAHEFIWYQPSSKQPPGDGIQLFTAIQPRPNAPTAKEWLCAEASTLYVYGSINVSCKHQHQHELLAEASTWFGSRSINVIWKQKHQRELRQWCSSFCDGLAHKETAITFNWWKNWKCNVMGHAFTRMNAIKITENFW